MSTFVRLLLKWFLPTFAFLSHSIHLLSTLELELHELVQSDEYRYIACEYEYEWPSPYDTQQQTMFVLINAQYLFKFEMQPKNTNTNTTTNRNTHEKTKYEIWIKNIPAAHNRYAIAMYSFNDVNAGQNDEAAHSQFRLIGVNNIDTQASNHHTDTANNAQSKANQSRLSRLSTATAAVLDFSDPLSTLSAPVISTYYTTINTIDAQTWQNITWDMHVLNQSGFPAPNIETSVRSHSSITLYDLIAKWEWTNNSPPQKDIKPVHPSASFYHERPSEFGYYCVYYKSDDEEYGAIPDCPNVTQILTEHALMLSSSGVDFLALDDTNLDAGPTDWYDNVLQVRPAQIIFETFHNLRAQQQTVTPDIVVWNKAGGVEWKTYLQLYQQYSDVVYTANDMLDNNKLKKVYFVPNINQSIINQIEADNGLHDIMVLHMWGGGALDPRLIESGTWTFFFPCRTSTAQHAQQTTSMESATECNFLMTLNSSLGSQISASFSWQNNYGSLPFSAPSKLNGRTLQLIVQDVLTMKPQNVLFPSFNEHAAIGLQSSAPFGGNNTWSNGLYLDAQNRNTFFVDTYGSEVSRSFEPTDESGDYYYRLFQSCVRVIKMEYHFGGIVGNGIDGNGNAAPSVSVCNINGEICCNALTEYNDIWSLTQSTHSDFMASNSLTEVQNAIKMDGYSEICAVQPYAGTSVFCLSSKDLNGYNAHRGPFILYANANTPSDGSLAVTHIQRKAIYRCLNTHSGHHFVDDQDDCRGGGANSKMEYILGYAAVSPSTAMARQIVRCQNQQHSYFYHAIGDGCLPGDVSSAVLGYAL